MRLGTQAWRPGWINTVAFSPSGREIVAGLGDGSAVILSADTGLTLSRFADPVPLWAEGMHKPTWATFSPDGRQLLVGAGNGAVLWDIESRSQTAAFALTEGGHPKGVSCVAFSPDGRTFTAGSRDGQIVVWGGKPLERIRKFDGHATGTSALAFAPDGKTLLSGGSNGGLTLWNLETGEFRTFEGHPTSNSVRAIGFSPDGRQAVTSGGREPVLWDVATGKEVKSLLDDKAGNCAGFVGFRPGGREVLSIDQISAVVSVWDVETSKVSRILEQPSKGITYAGLSMSGAFSPDGHIFAAGGSGGSLLLWDLKTGKRLLASEAHEAAVTSVAFSSDGRFVLTGSRDRTAALWNLDSGKRERVLEVREAHSPRVAISPDGRSICSTDGKRALMWALENDTEARVLQGEVKSLDCMAFSDDGLVLAAGCGDGSIILWEVLSAKRLRTMKDGKRGIHCVQFDGNGRQLFTAGGDGKIVLWEMGTGLKLREFESPGSTAIFTCAISPSGSHLLSGGLGKSVALWDVRTGKILKELEGHHGSVTAVAFSPDGSLVASASRDRTIIVWDLESGMQLRHFKGHLGQIEAVCFSPDGRRLVSGSTDTTALVWDLGMQFASRAEEWVAHWKLAKDAERRKAVEEAVADLAARDFNRFCLARERLRRLREEGIEAIVRAFPATLEPETPSAEKLSTLLGSLDSQEIETRNRARDALAELGPATLDWIRLQLQQKKDLSEEVRASLDELRKRWERCVPRFENAGSCRAILLLAEMLPSEKAKMALEQYAASPKGGYAANLAQRALALKR